jgi:hypothetical protein
MLEARDELRSAMDLYFSIVNSPSLYLEVQFLNLAQALESLHRSGGPATLLPNEQFAEVRRRMETMLQANDLQLPKDARFALCRRLEYWNEVSLRRRLKAVVEALRPEAQRTMGSRQSFVHAVADARNYLTHRDPRLRHAVEDVKSLIRLTRRMRFVVQQSLMMALGIPDTVLDRHARQTAADMRIAQIVG